MDSVTEAVDPTLLHAQHRVGTTLRGKWHLDRLLGLGGMAAVYAATHRNGTRGAIKMLHVELSTNSHVRTRFLREGYAANKVDHPCVVRVLDDDVAEDGAIFVVMELLDGETLEERRVRVPRAKDPDPLRGTLLERQLPRRRTHPGVGLKCRSPLPTAQASV